MSTIVHLLLAVVLTLFLAAQVNCLLLVLRSRRAAAGRTRRRTDMLWTVIPVAVVLFLAARSWLAAFDIERPAVASAVIQTEPTAPLTPGPPR